MVQFLYVGSHSVSLQFHGLCHLFWKNSDKIPRVSRTSTQRFLQSKVEHAPELTEDIMKGKDLHQMIAHSHQGAHCLHF